LKEKTKNAEPSPHPSDGEEEAKRSRIRFALDSLPGVVKEICNVYREMRADRLDHLKGRSLVWVLSMPRAALEAQTLERLEERLDELAPSSEGKPHGNPPSDRPHRTAH
jgi:hypothetical protein